VSGRNRQETPLSREGVLGIIGLLALAALVLACGSSNPSSSPLGATGGSQTPGGEQSPGEESPGPPTLTDPRIASALELRSVRMEWTTRFPGKQPTRVLASVDAQGNYLIETNVPLAEGSSPDPSAPNANVLEIYVIDGSAYSRVGKEGEAGSAPEQADALRTMLYNPAGPGLCRPRATRRRAASRPCDTP
jgi:hypothetical protein